MCGGIDLLQQAEIHLGVDLGSLPVCAVQHLLDGANAGLDHGVAYQITHSQRLSWVRLAESTSHVALQMAGAVTALSRSDDHAWQGSR